MKADWIEVPRGDVMPQYAGVYVTMNPKGDIVLSRVTYEMMGGPAAFVILYDPPNLRIGLKPAALTTRNAHPARVSNKCGAKVIPRPPPHPRTPHQAPAHGALLRRRHKRRRDPCFGSANRKEVAAGEEDGRGGRMTFEPTPCGDITTHRPYEKHTPICRRIRTELSRV